MTRNSAPSNEADHSPTWVARVDQRTVGSVELAGDRGRLVEHHEHLHVAQGVVDLVGRHRGVGIIGRADRGVHRGHGAVEGDVDAAALDGGVEAVGDPTASGRTPPGRRSQAAG